VATALAAVNASAMTVQQAAAAVIGMDIGTTVTALLATVGGSVHAKRTGYAHSMYNLFAGTAAFLILVPFMQGLERFAPRLLDSEPELVLVGFHTLFNVIGVSVALPFAAEFGALLVRLVPIKAAPFTQSLDRSLLDAPAAALDALGTTLADLTAGTFELVLQLLSVTRADAAEARVTQLREALGETREYVERIRSSPDQGWTYDRHLSAMHVIDHLDRMADRCEESDRWATLREDPELAIIARQLEPSINEVRKALVHGERTVREDALEAAWQVLQDQGRGYRQEVLERVAAGEVGAVESVERLDAARGARRVAYHAWRIAFHLNRCRAHEAPEQEPRATLVPPHAEAEPPDPSSS
jgi:phosphate:Na+ symporter